MSGTRRSPRLAEKRNVIYEQAKSPEALQNDVILQHIFKYLGYEDLKTIRDVKNAIWLRNSRKAWWSRVKVVLYTGKVKTYLQQTQIHSWARNLELINFLMDNYNGIWNHFGHSIKHLELNFCIFNSVDEFRQLIYTKCPNLEKLVIRFLKTETSTDAVEPTKWQEPQFGVQKNLKFLKLHISFGSMPFSWMELLSHFPSLEALEAWTNVDVYKVISLIRQHDPKKLKLKHIDIESLSESSYEESLRLVLLDPNLSFETIRIGDETCSPETLRNILSLHAKSLKEWFFVGAGGSPPTEIMARQPLVNLEILSLGHCLFSADFFRCTPNLRKVDLNYNGSNNLLERANSNLRISTCRELRINVYGQCSNSANWGLPFFLTAFPNVEKLEITGLNNQQFSMICERWTKLVSFTVPSNSLVDDFGLLGFDPRSKTLTARKPNITNLKDLQIFYMESQLFQESPVWANSTPKKMKNAAVVLRELENLPHLKQFGLHYYQLKNARVWNKAFAKYPYPEDQ